MRARSKSAFVVGMGQLGGFFAEALRVSDHEVVELRRGDDLRALAGAHATPDLLLVAVGEDELDAVLGEVPEALRDRVVLLQNELVPPRWARAGLASPTLAIVWFERKGGQPPRVILPTRVEGGLAVPLVETLLRVGVAAQVITRDALATELVAKNAYILVTNLAGLEVGGDTGALCREHAALRDRLFDEVLAVQRTLVGEPFDATLARQRAIEAMLADEAHVNAGRTALARARRVVESAERNGVEVPTARAIVGRSTR